MIRIDRDHGGVRLTFILRTDTPAGRVSVVGNFNDWRPGAHELRPRSNGTRSATVVVTEGERIRFRYLAEGGQWSNEIEHPDVQQIGEDSTIIASPSVKTRTAVPAAHPRPAG